MRLVYATLLLTVSPLVAEACPVCLTDTGEAVRAGIFAPDFAENIAIAVLPFAVAAGLARAVSAVLSPSPKRPR
jgi:hypothetical protein